MTKPLVIVLSQTREFELTFDSFKKNVIDELDADLCLCIGVKNDYDYNNPFFKLSKYNFLYNEENDPNFKDSVEYSYKETNLELYEKLENINFLYCKIQDEYHIDDEIKYLGEYESETYIDLNVFPQNDIYVYHKKELPNKYNKKLYSIKHNKKDNYIYEENVTTYVKKLHYTEFLEIKHKIAFENSDPNHFSNFLISTYIHIFFLWFLEKNMQENDLFNKYDRFIIVRSDFIYQLPIPKLALLDEKYIWVPDGEHHGGICDRLVILSKHNIKNYINILQSFYKKSNQYYAIIKNDNNLNMESLLKIHLSTNGLINTVKYFPYIMYCIRSINGTTRWASGQYSEEHGYYIKYSTEYEKSTYYKNLFIEKNLSIDDFYKEIIN